MDGSRDQSHQDRADPTRSFVDWFDRTCQILYILIYLTVNEGTFFSQLYRAGPTSFPLLAVSTCFLIHALRVPRSGAAFGFFAVQLQTHQDRVIHVIKTRINLLLRRLPEYIKISDQEELSFIQTIDGLYTIRLQYAVDEYVTTRTVGFDQAFDTYNNLHGTRYKEVLGSFVEQPWTAFTATWHLVIFMWQSTIRRFFIWLHDITDLESTTFKITFFASVPVLCLLMGIYNTLRVPQVINYRAQN